MADIDVKQWIAVVLIIAAPACGSKGGAPQDGQAGSGGGAGTATNSGAGGMAMSPTGSGGKPAPMTGSGGSVAQQPGPADSGTMQVADAQPALPGPDGGTSASCDRACLLELMDDYLDALVTRDASKLPKATSIKSTENGLPVALGEGVWKTATKLGSYVQMFADASQGVVGSLAVIDEGGDPALLVTRLKVTDRLIAESETLVTRDGESTFFSPQSLTMADPIWEEVVPVDKRPSREELAATANAYFDGIVSGDGSALTFDAQCKRLENGVETASGTGIGSMFGAFSYIDRIDRRVVMIDEERGLVWGIAQFQVPGGGLQASRTTFVPELFKVIDGTIRSITAFLLNTPYGTPSGWE